MKIHEQCHYLLCNKWPLCGRWRVSWKNAAEVSLVCPQGWSDFSRVRKAQLKKSLFWSCFGSHFYRKRGSGVTLEEPGHVFCKSQGRKALKQLDVTRYQKQLHLRSPNVLLFYRWEMYLWIIDFRPKVCMSEGFRILSEGFQWIHSGCFLCNMNGGPIHSEVMANDQDMEVFLGDFRDKGYLGSILESVDFSRWISHQRVCQSAS